MLTERLTVEDYKSRIESVEVTGKDLAAAFEEAAGYLVDAGMADSGTFTCGECDEEHHGFGLTWKGQKALATALYLAGEKYAPVIERDPGLVVAFDLVNQFMATAVGVVLRNEKAGVDEQAAAEMVDREAERWVGQMGANGATDHGYV